MIILNRIDGIGRVSVDARFAKAKNRSKPAFFSSPLKATRGGESGRRLPLASTAMKPPAHQAPYSNCLLGDLFSL